MKAKDWKFDKYLPDHEDIDAECNASEAYFSLPLIKGVNEAEFVISAFHAGFMRGMAWAIAKLSSEKIRYAKVKDNFAKNDKGKEAFIGKIGRIIQIENDYSCFSQVLLEFENGVMEMFSNTALTEVDKNDEIVDLNDGENQNES